MGRGSNSPRSKKIIIIIIKIRLGFGDMATDHPHDENQRI